MAQQHGWVAVPEEIVNVLSTEGFEECTRKPTTSQLPRLPGGGLWQGVHPRTGSAASATWMNRPVRHYTLVFVEIDGESVAGGASVRGAPGRPSARAARDPSTGTDGATTGNGGQRHGARVAPPRSEAWATSP
jgi:hypothetical protein